MVLYDYPIDKLKKKLKNVVILKFEGRKINEFKFGKSLKNTVILIIIVKCQMYNFINLDDFRPPPLSSQKFTYLNRDTKV